jgi:ribosomal protein S4E
LLWLFFLIVLSAFLDTADRQAKAELFYKLFNHLQFPYFKSKRKTATKEGKIQLNYISGRFNMANSKTHKFLSLLVVYVESACKVMNISMGRAA